jgi:hypothetical protein
MAPRRKYCEICGRPTKAHTVSTLCVEHAKERSDFRYKHNVSPRIVRFAYSEWVKYGRNDDLIDKIKNNSVDPDLKKPGTTELRKREFNFFFGSKLKKLTRFGDEIEDDQEQSDDEFNEETEINFTNAVAVKAVYQAKYEKERVELTLLKRELMQKQYARVEDVLLFESNVLLPFLNLFHESIQNLPPLLANKTPAAIREILVSYFDSERLKAIEFLTDSDSEKYNSSYSKDDDEDEEEEDEEEQPKPKPKRKPKPKAKTKPNTRTKK